MKITQLDINVVGLQHRAPFELYQQMIPSKIQQTKKLMQALSMDKSERYIVYEPQKGMDHKEGSFLTGVSMEIDDSQVPADMEAIHVSGDYATYRTIFIPSRMREFYSR